MRGRARRRAAAVLLTAFTVCLAAPTPDALAAWSLSASGGAAASAALMPAGQQPVVSVLGTSVTVTWAAVSLPGAGAVTGYEITRFDAATGTTATVAAGCSGIVTASTCTELGVPAGTWTYSDTPVLGNWVGALSPISARATVA